MVSPKANGFEDLQRDLRKLQQNARRLNGRQQIPFDKLFTRSFMLKNTHFSSIEGTGKQIQRTITGKT